ncbi:hypothetical protein F8G81_09440 [Arthrobacter sp. CDRTa11]|uniref:hypothetical protein n=1 Tax=Arthrobacter sp. CDRTa11 TaxID=2651199 RepID=UPI002265C05B|nr:hypothetical protein [Arthrobacter sp. CDRTa11]UZX02807.1 hypothetical protein F8G81_09440 [Arthrobacter sp. CDRTa11]
MKYRVHEIARMTGLESEVIIDHLRDVGEFVRSSASGVEDVVAVKVLEFFGAAGSEPKAQALPAPKPISFTPPTMYTWEANPVPEPRKQEVLDRITALERRFPAAAEHRRMLKGLGSQFVFAKTFRASDGKTLGLALARFSGAIEAAFGITREVMFFYTPYRDLQIRSFTWAKDALASLSRDATPDLVLFHSPDERLTIKLEDWSRLAFTAIPLASGLDPDPISLVRLIRDHVYARDLFYETTPVRGERFFGRKTLLQELRDDVTNQRVSGLFGLRKSGKTSILLQLSELIDSNSSIPVFVDLEVLPSPPSDPTLPLIVEIAARLRAELEKRGIPTHELAPLEADPGIPALKSALQKLLTRLDDAGIKVTLMLDEIEFLTPGDQIDTAEGEFSGVAQVLGILRSMVQSTENFTFLLSGLTNEILENGRLYGRPNPLFSWAKARYIGPFAHSEASELATAVGSRMGIEIEAGALDALYDASGGHAYLYRNLASAVVGDLPVATYRRIMRTSDVLHRLIPWKRSIAGNLDEILGHLERYYPTEAILLEILAESPTEFQSLASTEDKAVHHLISLGLIHESSGQFTSSTLLELR